MIDPLEVTTEPIAHRIATGLTKLGLAIKSQSWRAGFRHGLTPTQGQILTFLRAQAGHAATLAAIADGLAITAATASDAVSALVAKGLVEKRPLERDGRKRLIVLTDRGLDEAQRVATWPDFLIGAVASLTPTEQVVFLRALVAMIRTLQERGEIPVARMCVTCRFFRPNVHPDPERPHHCSFVDAPFGDHLLRLDCPDHQSASASAAAEIWQQFNHR